MAETMMIWVEKRLDMTPWHLRFYMVQVYVWTLDSEEYPRDLYMDADIMIL